MKRTCCFVNCLHKCMADILFTVAHRVTLWLRSLYLTHQNAYFGHQGNRLQDKYKTIWYESNVQTNTNALRMRAGSGNCNINSQIDVQTFYSSHDVKMVNRINWNMLFNHHRTQYVDVTVFSIAPWFGTDLFTVYAMKIKAEVFYNLALSLCCSELQGCVSMIW
jgi:hypothetical protein